MQEQLKILLVDDEESIRKVVEKIMVRDGYKFCYAPDGEEALEKFKNEKPDLIILDVMLPELDGFDLCRIIRKNSQIPIIMVSAKGDIVDKSVGFNMGADDYLPKPFSPVELSLRVNALLRRMIKKTNSEQEENITDCIIHKDLKIDFHSYEVMIRDKKVDLTPKEFELLHCLASHPGQVFTRQQLFDSLWGEDYIGDTGTITVFIRKIREKIERDPARPEYIITIWGVGYKFCC